MEDFNYATISLGELGRVK